MMSVISKYVCRCVVTLLPWRQRPLRWLRHRSVSNGALSGLVDSACEARKIHPVILVSVVYSFSALWLLLMMD